MMIANNRSFPHPVLAPFRDDVSPNAFSFDVTGGFDSDNYYLDVEFSYDNETLARLVESGRAAHAIHLECRRNFYRAINRFKELKQRIAVRTDEIVGKIDVSGFIVALQRIPGYKIAGAHADYGDTAFTIRPGDVLAVCPTQTFDAYVDYDLLKRISSILDVRRSDDRADGPMDVDTAGDTIWAVLSHSDFDLYADLKTDPAVGALLANQVLVPALLEAISGMINCTDEEFEESKEKRWFRSIDKKLRELKIDIRSDRASGLNALQDLLQLPLRRSLEGIKNILAVENV